MDNKQRRALRKCHSDLQKSIDVDSILPDLRSELTDLEYETLANLSQNAEQVDELVHILLNAQPGNEFFHKLCRILRRHNYHHFAEKLQDEAGEYRPSVSCSSSCVNQGCPIYCSFYSPPFRSQENASVFLCNIQCHR